MSTTLLAAGSSAARRSAAPRNRLRSRASSSSPGGASAATGSRWSAASWSCCSTWSRSSPTSSPPCDPHDTEARAQLHRRRRRSTGSTTTGRFAPARLRAARARRDPRTFQLVYAPDPTEARSGAVRRRAIRTTCSACSRPNVHLLGLDQRAARATTLLPARHRPARPRSLVAPAVVATRDLAHHRPRRRGAQPVPRRAARRRLGDSTAAGSTPSIQRLIEILRSMPTIPLWMGLAAALPNDLVGHAGLLRHHASSSR